MRIGFLAIFLGKAIVTAQSNLTSNYTLCIGAAEEANQNAVRPFFNTKITVKPLSPQPQCFQAYIHFGTLNIGL